VFVAAFTETVIDAVAVTVPPAPATSRRNHSLRTPSSGLGGVVGLS